MRAAWGLLLAGILLAPVAAADYGPHGADGWPVNADGESTNPAPAGDPVNRVGPLTLYPYYPILTAEVQRLARDHPDLVKLHSAGKSTAGLDLWMLEIADFARIESGEGAPLEGREVVWIDGGTHSNEYSGVYFVAHVASFLLDEYESNDTARWIVENRHTWIMPLVNPDGSNLMGRLNARLVNINRNYPVVWDGQGNDPVLNNRGPEPASEIETRINIEWFNKTRPDYYASIHCCGNLWLYPYGEEGVDPIDNATLSRICDEAFSTVRKQCGPIWSTIYPASGSSIDTAYEYTGAAAFGYEMSGRGAVALWGQPFTPDSVRVQEVESWEGILHAFLNVHRYGAHPRLADAAIERGSLVLTVVNEGYAALANASVEVGGVSRELPALASGESVRIQLDGVALAEGELPVRFDYVKRLATQREGAHSQALTLARGATGALVVEALDAAPLSAASSDAPEGASVPAPSVLLVVAALGVALALRRR